MNDTPSDGFVHICNLIPGSQVAIFNNDNDNEFVFNRKILCPRAQAVVVAKLPVGKYRIVVRKSGILPFILGVSVFSGSRITITVVNLVDYIHTCSE